MFIKPMFRLRFVTEPPEGGSSEGGEELSLEEQIAQLQDERDKWKTLSRKHEKNRKPETYDSDMAELAQLREKQDENLKPDEKAVKEAVNKARQSGVSEGVASMLKPAVRAEFKARAPHLSDEELDELMSDIDVTPERFYENGELNVERIDRLAKRLAPEPNEDENNNDMLPNLSLGNVLARGQRAPGTKQGVDYYRQQEAARYQTKK